MSTGYAHKRGGGSRGNQWGQAYGSHGGEAGKGEMRLGVDFPYVCERCLGPNPYVQMIKSNFGAACKISKRPFHVFKWTNPKSRRRMKTVISYEAASVRNCCQACMCDMTYGVPLVVRDALLKAAGMGAHEDLPESEVGQSFFFNQRDREAELIAGGAVGMTAQEDPRLRLDNAAQVLRTGGGGDGSGSGVWANRNSSSSSSSGGAGRSGGGGGGGSTLWIASQPGQPLPAESAIRDAFMGFGAIRSVRCLTQKGFAFLEFESAQSAAAGLAAGVQDVAGFPVVIKWARSKNNNQAVSGNNDNNRNNNDNRQHQHERQRGNARLSPAPTFENRPFMAASNQALWQGPSATQGTVIPPAPPELRAFLSPETRGQRPPPLFPIPTFEQARKLYPSMRHSVAANW